MKSNSVQLGFFGQPVYIKGKGNKIHVDFILHHTLKFDPAQKLLNERLSPLTFDSALHNSSNKLTQYRSQS
jgi:hypothetical protein